MYLSSSSAAGVRFLATIKDGCGLKPSARQAGIDKEVGYRWLREKYVQLRRDGKTVAETIAELGFTTSRLLAWEAGVGQLKDRHHLRVDAAEEAAFWVSFDRGDSIEAAVREAGVARATGYRWIRKRFGQLRQAGLSVRQCQTRLRLADRQAHAVEQARLNRQREQRNTATAAQHAAVVSSNRYADRASGAVMSPAQKRRAVRAEKYWQLMREGVSNAQACRLLGMHRRTGTQLRQARNFQIPSIKALPDAFGRYLDGRERLRIADLLRLVTRCAASRQPWAGTRPPSSGNWTGTATLTATTCHTRPIMTPECNGAGRKCTSLLATGGCAPWCNAN